MTRSKPDAGFTLVEIIVSLMLIGIVMTALTAFLVNTVSAMGYQRARQLAVQLAQDATEQARGIKGSAVTVGRDQDSAEQQWASPAAGAAPFLANMTLTWDGTAVFPNGASAPLPTTARSVVLRNTSYDQHWYVGTCWQPAAGGDCDDSGAAGDVPFYRVVVAVTWRAPHCPASTCSYVTSTLISGGAQEPVFNSNETAQPPRITNPGDRSYEAASPLSLQLTASGGAPPLTWTVSGLPTGLAFDDRTGLISGTPTTPGSYPINVTATDGFGLVGTAAFRWTITPMVTSPGNRATAVGNAVSLQIPHSGAAAPLTWSATGLPAGLSIDTASGLVTGTPTTPSSPQNVTVTVTNRYGNAASVTFTWTISSLQLQTPDTQNGAVGTAINGRLTVTGGTGAYSWTAANLPAGLSISSSGLISGTLATGTRYIPTVTVTDAAGVTDSVSFVWNVSTSGTGLRVTAPTGDRTADTVGQNVSIALQAAGGSGSGYTWTAAGLPPGTRISGASITGSPTTAGTYTVKVTVRDSLGRLADFMFTWRVQ